MWIKIIILLQAIKFSFCVQTFNEHPSLSFWGYKHTHMIPFKRHIFQGQWLILTTKFVIKYCGCCSKHQAIRDLSTSSLMPTRCGLPREERRDWLHPNPEHKNRQKQLAAHFPVSMCIEKLCAISHRINNSPAPATYKIQVRVKVRSAPNSSQLRVILFQWTNWRLLSCLEQNCTSTACFLSLHKFACWNWTFYNCNNDEGNLAEFCTCRAIENRPFVAEIRV